MKAEIKCFDKLVSMTTVVYHNDVTVIAEVLDYPGQCHAGFPNAWLSSHMYIVIICFSQSF